MIRPLWSTFLTAMSSIRTRRCTVDWRLVFEMIRSSPLCTRRRSFAGSWENFLGAEKDEPFSSRRMPSPEPGTAAMACSPSASTISYSRTPRKMKWWSRSQSRKATVSSTSSSL